jgi:beta-glucosidase
MWADFTHIGQDAEPSQVSEEDINDSITRILASMFRIHLFESGSCTPPACDSKLRANVTSENHTKLARKAATESIVLLKNEDSILPIDSSKVRTVALVGSAADAPGVITIDYPGYPFPGDYYAGGGSGHVQTNLFVTPRAGIEAVAASNGIQVLVSPSNDIESALAQVRLADVTIISVGTTSTEDEDRASLDLDDNANEFISAVAKEAKSSVVIAQSPGAFLTPWRDDVQAIAALFLGGQETGSAWGDILFGKEAPSGRLPVMMPATADDQISPTSDLDIVYSEGMRTSYRNRAFKAAFPFGHGLTYTTFDFASPSIVKIGDSPDNLDVSLRVKNLGTVASQAVPQLYVEFPPEANHPVPLLKSFQKTSILKPGEVEVITFGLSRRDRSFWTPLAGWSISAVDDLIFHIGTSSSNIILSFSGADFGSISV